MTIRRIALGLGIAALGVAGWRLTQPDAQSLRVAVHEGRVRLEVPKGSIDIPTGRTARAISGETPDLLTTARADEKEADGLMPKALSAPLEYKIYDVRDLLDMTFDNITKTDEKNVIAVGTLQEFIKDSVHKDAWEKPEHNINLKQGHLIVTASPEIQKRIEEVLKSLREKQVAQRLAESFEMDCPHHLLTDILSVLSERANVSIKLSRGAQASPTPRMPVESVKGLPGTVASYLDHICSKTGLIWMLEDNEIIVMTPEEAAAKASKK